MMAKRPVECTMSRIPSINGKRTARRVLKRLTKMITAMVRRVPCLHQGKQLVYVSRCIVRILIANQAWYL